MAQVTTEPVDLQLVEEAHGARDRILTELRKTDRNSKPGRRPELARASVILGRMAANAKHLGQIFLESEAIS